MTKQEYVDDSYANDQSKLDRAAESESKSVSYYNQLDDVQGNDQREGQQHDESSYSDDEGNCNFYSSFSIFGQDNHEMFKEQQVNNANFHSKMMRILNPKLYFSRSMDLHFYKELRNKKTVLDEHGGFGYKELLIDQTRQEYQAELEREKDYLRKVRDLEQYPGNEQQIQLMRKQFLEEQEE